MAISHETPVRILVIARPALGRRIEHALRAVGHEVHRTPDPSSALGLATRLRPHIAVVALDLPWGDAEAAAHQLSTAQRVIPVLVLGDSPQNSFPRLPLEADANDLQEAIAGLLSAPLVTAYEIIPVLSDLQRC